MLALSGAAWTFRVSLLCLCVGHQLAADAHADMHSFSVMPAYPGTHTEGGVGTYRSPCTVTAGR